MFLFVKIAAKLYHTASLAWLEECRDQVKITHWSLHLACPAVYKIHYDHYGTIL